MPACVVAWGAEGSKHNSSVHAFRSCDLVVLGVLALIAAGGCYWKGRTV